MKRVRAHFVMVQIILFKPKQQEHINERKKDRTYSSIKIILTFNCFFNADFHRLGYIVNFGEEADSVLAFILGLPNLGDSPRFKRHERSQ